MSKLEKTVLAIDPGHTKCGLAVVRRLANGTTEILWRKVVSSESCIEAVEEAERACPFDQVVIGSGTTSQRVLASIRDRMPSRPVLKVDERNTTIEARARYWEHTKRKGWRMLLPATLQTPKEPVDDFVAVILAERILLGES